MANGDISLVHWFSELERHKCGYCKQINSNCSYGMWAESLTVDDYQYLIDRGWRRSGKYCYKSVMDQTCCPLYTIRCEALNFKLSKSQKKIIKRVNRFLSDSIEEKSCEINSITDDVIVEQVHHTKEVKKIDLDKIDIDFNKKTSEESVVNEEQKTVEQMSATTSANNDLKSADSKSGAGADLSKPPRKKAKLIRLEKKRQKLAARGLEMPVRQNVQNMEKSLEEFMENVSEVPAHKLQVCLVLTSGLNRNWTEIKAQEYQVYRKYQMNIHGDPVEKCSEKQFANFLLESPLQIVLKQMNTKDASYTTSAQLFCKYQMFVHDEQPSECDLNTFKEFLVDSPIKHVVKPGGPSSGYGSFHQQYWLDDKLIAVGVIDILPKCVSSVYFFYDPDYRHLTLGTYGSLRELYFVRQLYKTVPEIKYYYMGFYIHTCPKMRYKAKLYPSFLLCPETYKWFPMEHCIPKLDKEKYSRLNDDLTVVDKDDCDSVNDIDPLMVLIDYKSCIQYRYLKNKLQEQDQEYLRFGKLIGKKCVSRLLVVLRNADF